MLLDFGTFWLFAFSHVSEVGHAFSMCRPSSSLTFTYILKMEFQIDRKWNRSFVVLEATKTESKLNRFYAKARGPIGHKILPCMPSVNLKCGFSLERSYFSSSRPTFSHGCEEIMPVCPYLYRNQKLLAVMLSILKKRITCSRFCWLRNKSFLSSELWVLDTLTNYSMCAHISL